MFTKDGLDREFFLLQDMSGLLKESEYFEPKRKIVGVLRVYDNKDKTIRQEFRVVPSELGIDPQQYLKQTGFIDSMFEKLPMLRSSITAGLFW